MSERAELSDEMRTFPTFSEELCRCEPECRIQSQHTGKVIAAAPSEGSSQWLSISPPGISSKTRCLMNS